MIFHLGELFCGPGGLAYGATHADIGLQRWSIRHAWANDYDRATCETYRANICPNEPETVICQDVHTLDIEGLPRINAFAFGFPCNDFSVVGEHKGFGGIYGPLYTYGVRVLQRFQPIWFVAENVSGLRSANKGTAFRQILRDLSACGYRLYPNMYSFEQYGIPQARHRVIIVGIRADRAEQFLIPSIRPFEDVDNTCRNAIENPPIPPEAPNNEAPMTTQRVRDRLAHILPGQNAFTAQLPPELELHVAGARISQIYKRLDPTRPSYTVTGSGGGGTHIYHWQENRSLTNRERARLQTFPDDFVFCGSKEEARRQIGMAVPCAGAKIIFEAILRTFAHRTYESMPSNMDITALLAEDEPHIIE